MIKQRVWINNEEQGVLNDAFDCSCPACPHETGLYFTWDEGRRRHWFQSLEEFKAAFGDRASELVIEFES